MAHDHHHHNVEKMGDRRLVLAITGNGLLTLAQIVGGVLSSSLSLIADALHNLSDAAALVIALVARKIGRKPPDDIKTFGYKRAENIAALINLVTLVIIGFYLIYEAAWRFFEQPAIDGWIVVYVAGLGLLVDIVTALMTYTMAKTSTNIKAAFIHNVSDALASLGVMISGTLIILFGWYWTDTLLTIVIALYVLWHGFKLLPETIHFLMEGAPSHLVVADIVEHMENVEHVENVHHLHIWYLDEHRYALEAHVVVDERNLLAVETIKANLKKMLHEKFEVGHSTLEIEVAGVDECTQPPL